MSKVDISSVNVAAELERIGWDYDPAGDDELRCKCPFHSDATPSCGISVSKKLFKCQAAGCGASGDFLTFLAKALNTTRRVVYEELSSRYDLEEEKVIDPQTIERYHAAVWDAKTFLAELYKRGVTDELIRRYRIGFYDGRLTIPIPNDTGLFVNVRKYLPGAPGPEKMKNAKGHGRVRLFPVAQLKYDSVVVCGGELKAIVSAALLNPHGIGAITATAGEGNWENAFSERLKGKRVYVMMDVDDAGRTAAQRVCHLIQRHARWVGDVVLPLDVDKYPHGDVNDWVGQEKATATDFIQLLRTVKEWEPPTRELYSPLELAEEVDLARSVHASYTGKRIRVRACVSAMDQAPYVVPKVVCVACGHDEDGCLDCGVYGVPQNQRGVCEMTISPESPALLEMVGASKKSQREALREAVGCYSECKSVEFVVKEWYNVEDARLSPQLQITSRSAERVMQPALCVGHGLELNESYEMTGRMFPHPSTQQTVLLISESHATQDALSNYKPTDDELASLRVFQPGEWTPTGIQRKLDDLYEDLESNVTRIFLRRDLHLAVDLAYHSPLLIRVDGKTAKGWTEVLVVGDSAQGKTETTQHLMAHYGLGEKVECKNASVAGLLGGLQQMGTRWFITWGVIPTHDKRLVVLEELKGASTEVISKLTDMRSSGIAEIPKIEKRRTHARTRLIALSNPRSNQPMSAYNYGVDAIRELVGNLEDLRRFDMAVVLATGDVDSAKLNQLQRTPPKIAHLHDADLCRRCVLWAWTREPSEVVFEDDASTALFDHTSELCEKYCDALPIVDRGSMRYKLARLSAALAGRTFSHGEDPRTMLVRRCHVDYVAAFLDRTYSSSAVGYADFSAAAKATEALQDPALVVGKILQTPFPKDFVENLINTTSVDLRDVCDWCGWDKTDAIQLLSFLVRKHALARDGWSYRKTPSFIKVLKELRGSEKLKAADRPSHIKEEF